MNSGQFIQLPVHVTLVTVQPYQAYTGGLTVCGFTTPVDYPIRCGFMYDGTILIKGFLFSFWRNL